MTNDAKYPGADVRKAYLDSNFTQCTSEYKSAFKSMYWIMDQIQAYLVKQYSIRDEAVNLLKEGNVEEAVKLLEKIGDI